MTQVLWLQIDSAVLRADGSMMYYRDDKEVAYPWELIEIENDETPRGGI